MDAANGMASSFAVGSRLGRQRVRKVGGRRRLDQAWTRTLVLFLVLVGTLGVVAYASTAYQRSAFNATTSRFANEVDRVVALIKSLRAVEGPAAHILYASASSAHVKRHVSAFESRRVAVEEGFDGVAVAIHEGHAEPLRQARLAWDRFVAEVDRAQRAWRAGQLPESRPGGGAFTTKAQRLRDAQEWLTELTEHATQDLWMETAAVNRVQALIPIAVLTILLATLIVGAWWMHRLSGWVIAPVLRLRDAALRMRDGDLESPVEAADATAELHDLADAMNGLAVSLRSSHQLLHEQARTDWLTGLPNRKALTDHLRERASGLRGSALLFVDIDDFKVVNDSLGHTVGDELLRIAANRLRASAREVEMVARLGGDEFAIVLDVTSDHAAALTVAERVLDALAAPITIDRTALSSSCSIGIAFADADHGAVSELIRHADIAMYAAKSRGKNCFDVFADSMHSEMLDRIMLKADLVHAAGSDELALDYQPVVDLATGRIVGWEALVRWNHPDRGLLSPMEFVPLAEETGDIVEIGEWVLDRACAELGRHLRRPGDADTWVSVNIASKQLAHPGFVETVRRVLARHGLAPSSLVLEVTEAVLIVDTQRVADALGALQADGIRVAVDDFGTGFSSLAYLHHLPVDIMKIDRSFLRDGKGHAGGCRVLQAILRLGEALGLEMIAEGVEHSQDLERFRGVERLAVQGFLIARPMRAQDAARFTVERALLAPAEAAFLPA